MNKKNNVYTAMVLLLSGTLYPIFYVFIGLFYGADGQAVYLVYKSKIDFITPLILLGLDKSYIHFSRIRDRLQPTYHLSVVGSIVILACAMVLEVPNAIAYQVIALGVLSAVMYCSTRAFFLVRYGKNSLAKVTVLFYISNLLGLFFISMGVPIAMNIGSTVFIISIAFFYYKNTRGADFNFFNKNLLVRDLHYGASEVVIGISASVFPMLAIIWFEKSIDQAKMISDFGLLILIMGLLKYPVQMMMPIIINANVIDFDVRIKNVLAVLGGGCLIGLVIEYLISLNGYILPTPGLISFYISTNLISYLMQILIFKQGKVNLIYVSNFIYLIVISFFFLLANRLNVMVSFVEVLAIGIISEFVKLSLLMVGLKK